MSAKSTIKVQIETILKGRENVPGLKKDLKALSKALEEVQKANKKAFSTMDFAAMSYGFSQVKNSCQALSTVVNDLCGAYNIQAEAETKLQTVMQQRMNATDAEIQSIKDLASAQQQIGIIGDEVQLAGAQQVATFLKQKSSIETLLPAMNDLLAQQKGFGASGSDAVAIANLMGKAMQGQTSALKRVGITFDENQEKVMKYGDETQRAAMLAQIITDNVGKMNSAMADTASGKMQQFSNWVGDLKEKMGAFLIDWQPYVSGVSTFISALANIGSATAAVGSFAVGVKDATLWLFNKAKALTVATANSVVYAATHAKNIALDTVLLGLYIKQNAAIWANTAAQKAAAAASATWSVVQKGLNLVLSANPIGVLITAIGGLVAAVIAAYKNFEGFRNLCDKVWGAVKPLATAILNGLGKAFEWVAEKAKIVWEWIKGIFGLGGKKVEVEIDVKPSQSNIPALDFGNFNIPPTTKAATPKATKAAKAEKPRELVGDIEILEDRISKLRESLSQSVGLDIKAAINKDIEQLERQLEYLQNYKGAPDTSISGLDTDATKMLPALDGTIKLREKTDEAVAAQQALQKQMGLIGGAANDVGSIFSSLGGAIGGVAGAMLDWASSTLKAIAQVIPQIATLITAKQGEAIAGATASGSSMPFPFNIVSIAAGVAAVLAQFANIPKFADGGIAFGPTLGLFGEYAGASNNPEVVAPLDKLRSLISPPDAMAGEVRFIIEGDKLVGVLDRRNKRVSRI